MTACSFQPEHVTCLLVSTRSGGMHQRWPLPQRLAWITRLPIFLPAASCSPWPLCTGAPRSATVTERAVRLWGTQGSHAAATGVQGALDTWRIGVAGNPHLCHLPACHQAVSAPMPAASALLTDAAPHPTDRGRAAGFGKNPSPSRIY